MPNEGALDVSNLEHRLDAIELFHGLPEEAVREFEAVCSWQGFEEGDQVFDKASDTLEVYFVVTGSVRILSYVTPEREVALADVHAGNFFGELAAIDSKERSARVVATESSVLASIEGPTFVRMMMKYPLIAVRVLQRFARIIRSLDARVTDLSTLTEPQRVFVELVRLAQPDPRRPGGWYIPDVPNHKEIASWAGTSKESVAQAIGELARARVIERKSMNLNILDFEKLRSMARAGQPPLGDGTRH